jgi:hypothetical protein
MPPAPSLPLEPMVPSRSARRCSACSGPLEYQGVRPLRTAAGVGMSESALVLEMFWCPHCAKVEFYSSR